MTNAKTGAGCGNVGYELLLTELLVTVLFKVCVGLRSHYIRNRFCEQSRKEVLHSIASCSGVTVRFLFDFRDGKSSDPRVVCTSVWVML